MELKEFIKTAIADITSAVSELQNSLDNGAIVNPTLAQGEHGKSVLVNNEVRMMERLNFDVAVVASETSDVEGKVKAGINILGANVGAEASAKTENISRLTFSIPIILPSVHVKTPNEIATEKRSVRKPVP